VIAKSREGDGDSSGGRRFDVADASKTKTPKAKALELKKSKGK
jgi:hypothetical protein